MYVIFIKIQILPCITRFCFVFPHCYLTTPCCKTHFFAWRVGYIHFQNMVKYFRGTLTTLHYVKVSICLFEKHHLFYGVEFSMITCTCVMYLAAILPTFPSWMSKTMDEHLALLGSLNKRRANSLEE